jgi:hypothetical protein
MAEAKMESDHQLVLQNGRATMTEASAQNYFFEKEINTVVAHADQITNNVLNNTVILPISGNGCTTAKEVTIDSSRYHLFVVDVDLIGKTYFTIPLDRALNRYMNKELIVAYKHINAEICNELMRYPALFVRINPEYKRAGEECFAKKGYVTGINILQDSFQISFMCHPMALRQQDLNEHAAQFDIWETEYKNELDESHWAVKEGSIDEAIQKSGIKEFMLTA